MLKRRIAVIVAGIFIGTQAGMAANEQGNSSAAENDQYVMSEPTQSEQASFDTAEVSSPVAADVNPVDASGSSVVTNLITVLPARTDAILPSADDMVWTPLPAQARYFEERAARTRAVARIDAIPPSADDMVWTPLPAQASYFQEREARTQMAVRGDAFPPSADDVAMKLLPSQVSYFDHKAGRTNVSMSGSPTSGSFE